LDELPEVYVARDEEMLKLRRRLLLANGIIIEGIYSKSLQKKTRSYGIDEINRS
jgi:hypothetical protein